MNIFASDLCPTASAVVLDDKRVIKMILESAQMLSTAMRVMGSDKAPYRSTHVNHPCTKWTYYCVSNYRWLLAHFVALCNEYTRRFGKVHKCQQYTDIFVNGFVLMKWEPEQKKHPNCTPFKHIDDVHEAYRQCLNAKWQNDKRPPKWTNAEPPSWYQPKTIDSNNTTESD